MSFRALIFHNFWLKCFSIALGTVIWMGVHYSIEHDFNLYEPGPHQFLTKQTVVVPVTLFQQPGDGRTFRLTPSTVSLTVLGEFSALHAPEMHDIKMFVDLTDFHGKGGQQVDIHPDLPHGLTVLDYKPTAVTVEEITP